MGVVRIELNRSAIRDLLQSEEVKVDLEERARRIASAAGQGFEVNSAIGRTRARAEVRSATVEARLAEARERVLTQAIDAGR